MLTVLYYFICFYYYYEIFVQYHIAITILFLIIMLISFIQNSFKLLFFWKIITVMFILSVFIFWTLSIDVNFFLYFEFNYSNKMLANMQYMFDFLSFLLF